jgi:hypothetical protein
VGEGVGHARVGETKVMARLSQERHGLCLAQAARNAGGVVADEALEGVGVARTWNYLCVVQLDFS